MQIEVIFQRDCQRQTLPCHIRQAACPSASSSHAVTALAGTGLGSKGRFHRMETLLHGRTEWMGSHLKRASSSPYDRMGCPQSKMFHHPYSIAKATLTKHCVHSHFSLGFSMMQLCPLNNNYVIISSPFSFRQKERGDASAKEWAFKQY